MYSPKFQKQVQSLKRLEAEVKSLKQKETLMPKTNAEVANKVRTEMTKEKLLKQFKDYMGEKEFRIFTNANQTLTINQSTRRTKL